MLRYANFILLDAAVMAAEIAEARARNKDHVSLFRDRAAADLDGVAPFLFRFSLNADFANWCLLQGWGRNCGLLLKSSRPMPELLSHLQQLIRVKSDEGQPFIFRFYDPRILRTFLPTCDASQLREFFGKGHVDHCVVEDADPAFALRFRQENGTLKTERFPVTDIIEGLPKPEPSKHQTVVAFPTAEPALTEAIRAKYSDAGLLLGHAPLFPGPQPEARAPSEKAVVPVLIQPELSGSADQSKWKLFD